MHKHIVLYSNYGKRLLFVLLMYCIARKTIPNLVLGDYQVKNHDIKSFQAASLFNRISSHKIIVIKFISSHKISL